MNQVSILDCTLRDGGYCNNWQFGRDNTVFIIEKLIDANIDIIECGFITQNGSYNPDSTKFATPAHLSAVLPKERRGKQLVAMINYGDYPAEALPKCDASTVDGIRVAFHKSNMDAALEMCRVIQEKGYKCYVQAMVSMCYTDTEFLMLISEVNKLQPYAFYIVDSFGMMKRRDLLRLFHLVEPNLSTNICLGFHSHNNLQLAYANAQVLTDLPTRHRIIIDSSVYGMGRGAGNLNTELFAEYLNEYNGTHYKLPPLLEIIDVTLNDFYLRNYWGYSLPNYLSAKHNLHPNYASYLDDKKTLTVEDMDHIFHLFDDVHRVEFDKSYISGLYETYMEQRCAAQQNSRKEALCKLLYGKTVLLIAPGKSAETERAVISAYSACANVISVCINTDHLYPDSDFIFLSNLRRFRKMRTESLRRTIVTSNIPTDEAYLKVPYVDLLNDCEHVRDNAGLMAIHLLISMGVSCIRLAGFDGYACATPEDNYAEAAATLYTPRNIQEAMNRGMERMLKYYSKQANIEFLTTPRHIRL